MLRRPADVSVSARKRFACVALLFTCFASLNGGLDLAAWAISTSDFAIATRTTTTSGLFAQSLVEQSSPHSSEHLSPIDRATTGATQPPAAEKIGGILPQIPIKYLPWIVVGFVLIVPLLTICVLKGCWLCVDAVAPMAPAPKPDNYGQRKFKELEEGHGENFDYDRSGLDDDVYTLTEEERNAALDRANNPF